MPPETGDVQGGPVEGGHGVHEGAELQQNGDYFIVAFDCGVVKRCPVIERSGG